MKASSVFRFIRRIQKMASASGKKRTAYAFVNVLLMALGVLSVLGVQWSLSFMSETSLVVGVLCLIVSVCAAIIFFLQGFVAQIALVFIAAAGIARPEERSGNIAALIIALLTTAGLIATCVILLKML